jgi:hypothetical protein
MMAQATLLRSFVLRGAFAFAFALTAAQGAEAASTKKPNPAHLEAARAYVVARNIMDIDIVMGPEGAAANKGRAWPKDLSGDLADRVKAKTQDLLSIIAPATREGAALVYARALPVERLQEATAFYTSPAGRAWRTLNRKMQADPSMRPRFYVKADEQEQARLLSAITARGLKAPEGFMLFVVRR